MGRIPRYLRVVGWIALFWIAVLAAIVGWWSGPATDRLRLGRVPKTASAEGGDG